MSKRRDERPALVPGAMQAGEICARWGWVEPSVWTDRMLMALETGVKGGKWYSLIDKMSRPKVLRAAYERVRRNGGAAGVDHVSVERFADRLEEELERLGTELRGGRYRPGKIRRVRIEKPGSQEGRPLGIPTVRDRVVQRALQSVLEPIFEAEFAESSYGFRPGLGCHDALRKTIELLDAGFTWVVDADLERFFDTLDHEVLMERVRERVADGRVLALLESYLGQEVMEGMGSWTPERGTPQGAVISPLLSNVYLNPFDHHMAKCGYALVRYADDFVILCRTRAEAERALAEVQRWVERSKLSLHPEKTRLVDATQRGGFDFLGYHFERGYQSPSSKSLRRFKATLRRKTKRTQGRSLRAVVESVNQTALGWWHYHRLSSRWAFKPLDQWIRMRLRSILRKQQKKRGRGRGIDHRQWPNRFFLDQGLFSLDAASAVVHPPSWR